MPVPGNLFSVNQESVETSIADWVVGSHSATLTQDTAHVIDGTHALKIVSTQTGFADAVSNNKITITAGVTYTFSFWCYTTTASLTCNAEVDWYVGATFNTFNDLTGSLVNLVQNQFTLVRLTATAPATTNGVVPILLPIATAIGQSFWTDAHFLGQPRGTPPVKVSQAVNRAATW